MNTIGPVIVYL
uniref:Uncharacterized protein n=1 Tax=Anguilla anguilla TaxID=7936 RepID=A0A0E9UT60_ANGAN